MTKDFSIDSIAIIGVGPGGLASLYEFLHTTKNGESTVGGSEPVDSERAFSKVVAFEQKDNVGGIWKTSLTTPDTIPHEILSDKIHKQDVIQPKIETPSNLNDKDYTVDSPLIVDGVDNDLQWRRSGVYPGLYTNVPRRFLRFSSIEYKEPKDGKAIDPLISYQEVTNVLTTFADDNDLLKHVRLNTQVQSVSKSDGKWNLTLRKTNPSTGKDEWYKESFDAIVVSSGHYSVPYIPEIEGLDTVKPGVISHSKSYRDVDDFKDKNVIIVGSSLSGVDIAQYIYPVAKSLYISRTPNKQEIFPWLEKAALTINPKPRISKIEGDKITFVDGSVLENVDKIIFATGYHWNYPYLADKFLNLSKLSKNGDEPTSASRVKGLYYDTFSQEDPTLGFVGVGLTSVKFHTLEVSASVLAGIWSNAKKLPSKEEQAKWEDERLQATADNVLFHYYPWNIVKEQWVDKIFQYAPKNRKNPLEGEDILTDFDRAFETAEKIFYEIKDGKIKNEAEIWNK